MCVFVCIHVAVYVHVASPYNVCVFTYNIHVASPLGGVCADIDILNGLEWSNALDKVWQENRQDDPDLLWQYFGSQTGIMRNFPGKTMSK